MAPPNPMYRLHLVQVEFQEFVSVVHLETGFQSFFNAVFCYNGSRDVKILIRLILTAEYDFHTERFLANIATQRSGNP